nr:MAG TPA: hypothetical protein [Caudoviricetes sp.]
MSCPSAKREAANEPKARYLIPKHGRKPGRQRARVSAFRVHIPDRNEGASASE